MRKQEGGPGWPSFLFPRAAPPVPPGARRSASRPAVLERPAFPRSTVFPSAVRLAQRYLLNRCASRLSPRACVNAADGFQELPQDRLHLGEVDEEPVVPAGAVGLGAIHVLSQPRQPAADF